MADGEQAGQVVRCERPAPSIMCVADGRGGTLLLGTTDAELCWLAQGIRWLLRADPLGGGGAIKVTAGHDTYWLSQIERDGAARTFRIASLYDRSQRIELPRDLIELVAELIEGLPQVDRA